MCGIAAYIGPVDPTSLAAVRRMCDAMAHRGPDGEGLWSSVGSPDSPTPGVVLGHRRLAIIDTSPGSAQPLRDARSGAAIAFNGEIYNFRSFQDALRAHGATLASTGDTEVLLKLLGTRHIAALPELRGIFAFARWCPERKRVLIARDHLGVKPLYHARIMRPGIGPAVVIASEVRALLASGLVDRVLDTASISSTVWNGFPIGPSTIIEGVRLMPAGTWAEIDPLAPEVVPRPYWTLPPPEQAGSGTVDALRAALEEAVELQLVSDVPLGVFLSGGIDSSSVANLASRSTKRSLRTINIGFGDRNLDESPYARSVADALGSDHLEVRLDGDEVLRRLDEVVDAIDQPTFDGINTYFVSHATRQAGITVALAGTGGDELFGGYSSFSFVPAARRNSAAIPSVLHAPLRQIVRGATRLRHGRRHRVDLASRWSKIPDVIRTSGSLVDAYQVFYALFTSDFADRLAAGGAAQPPFGLEPAVRASLNQLCGGRSPLASVSALELSCYLRERLLRDTDVASMASSLEVRVPLLDHRVVEAAFRLPDALRFQNLGSKHLLRRLGLSGLDPAIFDRPKAGFVLPMDRWLRAELRSSVGSVLCDPDSCLAAGLQPPIVSEVWRSFLEGAAGVYWTRPWSLYTLIRWCQKHSARLR
jgi:asparagine synthase (glutamine-hydrolysing)